MPVSVIAAPTEVSLLILPACSTNLITNALKYGRRERATIIAAQRPTTRSGRLASPRTTAPPDPRERSGG